jgi:hypothetical protein
VISDSSSSCFAGKILFCASVATPFPFIPLLCFRLLDDGDRTPDGEAVVPEETAGSLQVLGADELVHAPGVDGLAIAAKVEGAMSYISISITYIYIYTHTHYAYCVIQQNW